MNCTGCGTDLLPTEQEVNAVVDQVLESSLADAHERGGVCPLCGHSKQEPPHHRKTVWFVLIALAAIAAVASLSLLVRSRGTQREELAALAMERAQGSAPVTQLLGTPISHTSDIVGEITKDETGWSEGQLTIPVKGNKAYGYISVRAGRSNQKPWTISDLTVTVPLQSKLVNVLTNVVSEKSPATLPTAHVQAQREFELLEGYRTRSPQWDGKYPCIRASNGSAPALTQCEIAVPHSSAIDDFQVDLRRGEFAMHQSDLMMAGVLPIPFTRGYRSGHRFLPASVEVFGQHSYHSYGIALTGGVNPYTYVDLTLEDLGSIHFSRISKGTSYADAQYEQTEVDGPFYGARVSWNGGGWDLKLRDGSSFKMPDSYMATKLRFGSPLEYSDAKGHTILFKKDGHHRVTDVTDRSGTPLLHLEYNDNDRLTRVTDAKGAWVTYEYDDDLLLTKRSDSQGNTRIYRYRHDQVTEVLDEHGTVLVENLYASGVLLQQRWHNGDVFRIKYDFDRQGNILGGTVFGPRAQESSFRIDRAQTLRF